ncbi:MAG TPA: aldo/keto reductase [Casimicrobiaceae bacterium]|nr:aldo/keto reductase [Casimicrobiaceae bacterium]
MHEPLGFGGAPLGNLFAAIADDAALKLVRHAYDRGIRYFDTAPHYGNGLSEHRIGAALRELPRNAYVLSTKVGRLLVPDAGAPREQNSYVDVLPFVQRWDYSRDGTLRSIDDSLQRLGLARIDYVFIHDVARDAHGEAQPARFREAMEGAVPALARLKAERAIAGFGLGVNEWQVCVDALAHADLDVLLLAGRYTLLDQSALPELLPLCVARGTRVVLGGPFNSGILATGAQAADGRVVYYNYAPATAEILGRVRSIEAVCAAHRVSLKAAALQFPRAHPAIACVLAGARSEAELDENIALASAPIPDAFWRDLRAQRLVAEAAPLPCDAQQ